jgi:hypothetical protein
MAELGSMRGTKQAPLVKPPKGARIRYGRSDGEICQECKQPLGYVWNAPDWLWERVMGGPGGVLCATCFVEHLAREIETLEAITKPALPGVAALVDRVRSITDGYLNSYWPDRCRELEAELETLKSRSRP